MDAWTTGLVAVVVVGLALIVYGALADRARNRRAAAEILSPPGRSIPQFAPDSPSPMYLSELQARRRPATVERPPLSPQERRRVTEQTRDPATVRIAVGYLSRDFVTDASSGLAVLDGPQVLVCSDPVATTRELLGVLERFVLGRAPLVLVAPALSDEVRATLEVNVIHQGLPLLAVVAPGADLERIAAATGASPRDRSDLQAGYVQPEHLGSCGRWVGMAKESFIVAPAGPGARP